MGNVVSAVREAVSAVCGREEVALVVMLVTPTGFCKFIVFMIIQNTT